MSSADEVPPCCRVDAISDVRKEFSYSARRIINSAVLTLIGLHYFACFLWFVVRVQDFPDGTR